MGDFKYLFKFIVVIFIFVLLVSLLGGVVNYCTMPESEQITRVDTVRIYIDSVRIEEKTQLKYINKIDTFYIQSPSDTIRDTVWLKELPIEYKQFTDTIVNDSMKSIVNLNYHGFNAGVDNLQLYTETVYKCKQPKQLKKFGWNLSVGPYIGYGTDFRTMGPSAGISVQLGWGWRISNK